ncbi:unnamed protein product [Pleuronectes platessa]|uniref:Uncharacterized protein n=1 Tax=Pleuronectes platessa TaxID=8262 RepID=A0A9N7YH44_PLEPL|nr:unnamed protein product [Pleuronectes platessa]
MSYYSPLIRKNPCTFQQEQPYDKQHVLPMNPSVVSLHNKDNKQSAGRAQASVLFITSKQTGGLTTFHLDHGHCLL